MNQQTAAAKRAAKACRDFDNQPTGDEPFLEAHERLIDAEFCDVVAALRIAEEELCRASFSIGNTRGKIDINHAIDVVRAALANIDGAKPC